MAPSWPESYAAMKVSLPSLRVAVLRKGDRRNAHSERLKLECVFQCNLSSYRGREIAPRTKLLGALASGRGSQLPCPEEEIPSPQL